MATRAFIGSRINSPTGSTDDVKLIYIHNGHPSDIGDVLLSNYDNESAALSLIDGGDMSCFGEDWDGIDPVYYKDRNGEEWENIRPRIWEANDVIERAPESDVEYVYIRQADGWFVACTRGGEAKFDLMPLKEAMLMIDADEEGRW